MCLSLNNEEKTLPNSIFDNLEVKGRKHGNEKKTGNKSQEEWVQDRVMSLLDYYYYFYSTYTL